MNGPRSLRRVRPTGQIRSHTAHGCLYAAVLTAGALATVWALVGDHIHQLLKGNP